MDFLSRLFDTSDFFPRWVCGNWSADLGWMHIVSDLGIWSAYFTIPIVLGLFVLRRRDLPFRSVFVLFGAFILFCGLTHLMDAAVFWWPAYRLAGVLKLATAIVSWATVVALARVVPRALSIQSAQEQFRQLAESIPQLAWMADATGYIYWYNRRFYDYTGTTFEQVKGWGWQSVHDPEILPEVMHRWPASVASGEPFEMVFPVRRHDGVFRPFLTRVVPFRDKTGTIVRWFGTNTDIGQAVDDKLEIENLNRELRQRVGELQSVLDVAPAAIWIAADPECRQVVGNRLADELLGVEPGTNVSANAGAATLALKTRAADPAGYKLPLEKCLALQAPVVNEELDLVTADGSPVALLANAIPVRNASGVVTGAVAVCLDITARKRAEVSLLDHSRKLRQLAEIASRLNVVHDIPSVLGIVTEEARNLIGVHRATATVANGDRETSARSVSDERRSLADAAEDPDGLTTPIIGPDGREIGRIRLEHKYEGGFTADDRAILLQLAQMASIAVENARLYQDLRDADRRKDEFLATLAHELRNPLAPVRSALEVMRRAKDDPKILEKSRSMMERQVSHMVRLIDDLLDISRISSNKLELRREPLDLNAVLHTAIETARPLIDGNRHTLHVALPTVAVPLEADPTRLAQVFANLLNNAAKYTPPGGRIDLRAAVVGDTAVVEIRDSGIGIPPEKLGSVFDLFTQLDSGLERAGGGLGIGLSLVRRLVEMHGGTVEAASAGIGRGSEFTVRLNLLVGRGAESDPETAPVSSSGDEPRTRKILVVDDNEDAAETLAMLLSIAGNEVVTAYDGLSAVEKAVEFVPDVVLLDIGLPKLNGYEAARRIRERLGSTGIVLVALTGWGQDEDRRRSAAAGFDHHLVKPVAPATLAKLLAGL